MQNPFVKSSEMLLDNEIYPLGLWIRANQLVEVKKKEIPRIQPDGVQTRRTHSKSIK